MTDEAGVWIDHSKAVVVSVSAGQATATTLQSNVAGHPHYGGQQDGGGERKYEERHRNDLDRFYDAVIARLAKAGSILILGPGEAKHELQARLGRATAHAGTTIAVDAADKLTDPQIVARVKAHFGIDR